MKPSVILRGEAGSAALTLNLSPEVLLRAVIYSSTGRRDCLFLTRPTPDQTPSLPDATHELVIVQVDGSGIDTHGHAALRCQLSAPEAAAREAATRLTLLVCQGHLSAAHAAPAERLAWADALGRCLNTHVTFVTPPEVTP